MAYKIIGWILTTTSTCTGIIIHQYLLADFGFKTRVHPWNNFLFPLYLTSKAREHLGQINNIDSVNSRFTKWFSSLQNGQKSAIPPGMLM